MIEPQLCFSKWDCSNRCNIPTIRRSPITPVVLLSPSDLFSRGFNDLSFEISYKLIPFLARDMANLSRSKSP